jgi:hypothetical protein
MPKPTPEQIQEAGRKLQRGGLLGTGSSRLANRLVNEAGDEGQNVAMDILGAAADHKPRRWAR